MAIILAIQTLVGYFNPRDEANLIILITTFTIGPFRTTVTWLGKRCFPPIPFEATQSTCPIKTWCTCL